MAEPSRAPDGLAMLPARVGGRYEPLAKIAAGGMATVYLARASTGVGFGKLVALKCVHPHMADQPEFVNMFLDEARIASRVDHPNVATVFDAGEDSGTRYLAMEYLHGEPMSSLIRAWDDAGGPPEPRFCELAARVIADAAMGLHAAHELRAADGSPLDLVHRDVSPQNLFITFDGSVKVVDFGIAKAAGRLQETTTGVVKGKVAYMSPEQLRALPLDRRADVWALGVTLWEALTCRRLFRRDEPIATLQAVLDAEVVAPSTFEPRVPPELDRIVLRALERDRTERHASARELADELNAFIAGRGAHVGMAELADLMTATFAREKAAKDAWVRAAREGRVTTPPPPAAATDPTVSEVRPTRLTATEPVELPVRRGGLFLAAAVALAAGGLLAGGVALYATEPEAPLDRAALASPARDAGDHHAGERAQPGDDAATGSAVASSATETAPAGSSPAAIELPRGVEAPDPLDEPPAADAPLRARPRSARRRASATGPTATEPAPAPTPRAEPSAAGPPRAVRIVHPGGGWASLRVDGRAERNTPTTLAALPPGRHVLELRPYGRGAWLRHPLVVAPGATPQIVRVPLPEP